MSQYLNLKPVEFDKLSAKAKAKINLAGRMMLPKYDGCFCIFVYEDGVPLAVLSRDGKLVRSMEHIHCDLLRRYPWIGSQGFGKVAILGEAWSPSKDFAENSGAFRRHSTQHDLGFAPFDAVLWEGTALAPKLYSPMPYRDRLRMLGHEYAHPGPFLIHTPTPVVCEGAEHAERYARHLKAHGSYDGAIISDPDAVYLVSNGSAGEFLKIKPLLSFSLMVTGIVTDVGEKTGRPTGALVVRFKNTKGSKVATGLSEEQQANLEQFIGKIIEVQCMSVYPGEFGKMREPRFVGVRDDVTQADY